MPSPARPLDAADAVFLAQEPDNRPAGLEANAASEAGGFQRLEMTRVADLGHVGEEDAAVEVGGKVGLQALKAGPVEDLEGDALAVPFLRGQRQVRFCGIRQFKAAADDVAVVDACQFMEGCRQGGIHPAAVSAEEVNGRMRAGGVAGGDDAGAGPGGLPAEVALLDEEDGRAFAGQKPRRGQADDAAADDEDVRVLCHAGMIAMRRRWVQPLSSLRFPGGGEGSLFSGRVSRLALQAAPPSTVARRRHSSPPAFFHVSRTAERSALPRAPLRVAATRRLRMP